MKNQLFLIPAFALLLASCSSEEPGNGPGDKTDFVTTTSYLNINLRPTSGMGSSAMHAPASRADYEQGGGTYEDGTPTENKVSRVRFYFFNQAGVPFAVSQNVATNQLDNFIDWYPNDSEIGGPDHENETVEKTLNATLGLTFTDTEERPAQVFAVANPTDDILNFENTQPEENMSSSSLSLQQIRSITSDYLPYADDNFVMSNSVYVSGGEPVYATELNSNNFQSTPADAAKPENIVTIYIERVLARVDLGISLTATTLDGVEGTFYPVGTYTINDGANAAQENEAIYVKFLGWNVTSTTATSRLLKDINASWTDLEILGSTATPWSTSDYHRSFWAVNPSDVVIQFGNFGNVEGENFATITPSGQFANSLDIPSGTSYVTTYLQENANPCLNSNAADAPISPSKVIIAAQLVDNTGAPLTLCDWGYNKYTLQGLKNQIARALPNLYYQGTESGQTGWFQIDPDMITFTTVDPLGAQQGDKEYYVYAVLTPDAASKTWAVRSGDTYVQFSTQGSEQTIGALVNKYIRGIVNHAMIWNSGLTYYFFDIRHLGIQNKDAGYVGIVRNHLYRANVTSLKGLGTPVYDPGKDIHPEVTNPGETVIEAKINILSWRLVSNSYQVGWE